VKILTVLGTRPEIIRLSRIIPVLDQNLNHVLVHTGQNFEHTLSDIFFREMQIREPDYHLGIKEDTAGKQIAQILAACEDVFMTEKPDRILILGDTNSALCAIVAKRTGIPVFHMEAGNRCYNDRVPEEVNRRLIDHASDVLMPYTNRGRANLLREGIRSERIFVTGNPILEVIEHYRSHIERTDIMQNLYLDRGRFFLVTLHRAENVDIQSRLRKFAQALSLLNERYGYPVIVSTHPRTVARMKEYGMGLEQGNLRFLEPFGFFDFINLEKNAACVLSDSGTVQEECAILGVPNVTLRDVTERPETIECGSNILSGCEPESILLCTDIVLKHKPNWTPPPEYLVKIVSDVVINIITGFDLASAAITSQGREAGCS
jgi:UDP-N-acetylglucosamine 2-epimerase (non-hydrolysing)